MIESKRINIIVAFAVAFSLLVSIALVVLGNIQAENGSIKAQPEYATKIFGTDIISIEIIADEAEWQKMLDNATREEYIMADVVVNGTKFQKVGIRPKGNSSLMQVARSDSNRYSFRLKFDEYIKGQTCFGLESFVVNNMLGDNTYMKEYISYDLMKEIGVDAPYFGYADIKVNGKDWGLYLAVELYNDSYEQRVFGTTAGMLYNVKSMDMGARNMPEQPDGNNMPMPGGQNRFQRPEGNFQPGGMGNFQGNPGGQFNPPAGGDEKNRPSGNRDRADFQGIPGGQGGQGNFQGNPGGQLNPPAGGNENNNPTDTNESNFPNMPNGQFGGRGGFGGFGGFGGGSGGSLEYIDDNIESYRSIFNNVVGKPGTEKDYKRVVEAIKALSEGRDLEKYFDVDKILRYLAAHTIVVNLDSYSSNMAQNYYIYENNGKITILPWDYNLAWGGFQNGNASSVINFPINTPVSGVDMSRRPLIDKLLGNKEYLERYHSYLQQLIDNYFANGKFAEKIRTLDNLISDYVKNDATAFCTYDEYKTAISTFIKLGELRAQSVQGQLDGTVPSTTAEQNANTQKLVPAGDIKLSDLGSMMGGRGGIGFPGRDEQDGNSPWQAFQDMDFELMGKVMEILMKANGEISDEVKEELASIGLTTEQVEQITQMAERFGGMMQNRGDRTIPNNFGRMEPQGQNRTIPNFFPENAPAGQRITTSNMALIGVLSLVLIAAIIFAAKYKKVY
ncbi:CotH kinase family protein [Acetivibrio clariflavus]|uniref:CotH kinase family protein n=1 Tax=Acetivibrio clariflavus TaxID=288965 RepID=UPI0004B12296|nr:CotH kinase family protein [Acetivibrio clariflavus]